MDLVTSKINLVSIFLRLEMLQLHIKITGGVYLVNTSLNVNL